MKSNIKYFNASFILRLILIFSVCYLLKMLDVNEDIRTIGTGILIGSLFSTHFLFKHRVEGDMFFSKELLGHTTSINLKEVSSIEEVSNSKWKVWLFGIPAKTVKINYGKYGCFTFRSSDQDFIDELKTSVS